MPALHHAFARLARPVLLALAVALALPVSAQPLPSLGDSSDLSPSAERRIGEKIVRELYRDPDYIDDPLLAEYVQSLWRPLLSAARLRGELTPELDQRFAWQILLGKDRSINAFALPGGWLGLHLGLVAATTTRDELASVLAHELSHVTQRHISRLVTKERSQAPWLIGAMILGTLAASKSPEAAHAMISGGQALAVQNQLNFSRDMEREADRIGFGVMTQAGFEPQGFVTMFDKLQQASRLNDNGAFPYLRTHPLSGERMADMQARMPLGGRTAPGQPDLEHALMSARARVLSAAGVDTLRALVREADSLTASVAPQRQAAVLYAAAFAAGRLRDAAVADRLLARLKPLLAADVDSARVLRLLDGELGLLAGDAERAAAAAPAVAVGRPEMLLAAQAALQARRPADAVQRLQTWVTLYPADATAWQTLASAYGAQGQTLRAIRAEAEARVAWLDYPAAVDRLRAAQDLIRRGGAGVDHIEASIIDTRTRQVESLLREQALER